MLNPVEELSTVFLQDVRRLAPRRAALFVDADDASCRDVHTWLLGVVREDYGDVPDGLLLAVEPARARPRGLGGARAAGHARVGGTAERRRGAGVFAQAGIANDAVVSEIVRRSGGVPLALAVLAAERPESPEQVGDPNGTAVDGFLSSVSEPARRRLAVDVSIPRLLNRDVLAVLLERTDVLDDFAWLSELPFVKDAPEGWFYSEPVRVQMLRRSRRDAPESWTRLHGKLAAYYARLEPGEDERGVDPEWQAHELERAYHQLCSEPRRAVGPALNGFMSAFASDRRFARRYAEALRQAGIDTGLDRVRTLGDALVAGTAAIDADDNEKAREMFTTLLGEDALDDMWRAKASDWRGYLAALDGRLDEALQDFDTAVELEPDSAEYRIDRGRTLARSGRYEDALADLDRAIALDPENSVPFVVRAETHQLAGRLDEAAADVARAVELQPKNTAAWLIQADILQLTGKAEEALAGADRAVEIEPENPQAWVVHARVQQALGRTDAALADLDRAVSLAPDDVGMLVLRANAHVRTGDLARAREDLEAAIARSAEFSTGDAGALLAAMAPEEVEQRMAMAASLSGIDGREAAASSARTGRDRTR